MTGLRNWLPTAHHTQLPQQQKKVSPSLDPYGLFAPRNPMEPHESGGRFSIPGYMKTQRTSGFQHTVIFCRSLMPVGLVWFAIALFSMESGYRRSRIFAATNITSNGGELVTLRCSRNWIRIKKKILTLLWRKSGFREQNRDIYCEFSKIFQNIFAIQMKTVCYIGRSHKRKIGSLALEQINNWISEWMDADWPHH